MTNSQFCFLAWMLAALPSLLDAGDLGEIPFFQAVKGSWIGTGQITNNQGQTTPMESEMEARFTEDGATFTISGTMKLNENPSDFKWVYSAHEVEGLYMAQFSNEQMKGLKATCEVTYDSEHPEVRLEQVDAPGDTRLKLRKRVDGDAYVVRFQFVNALDNITAKGEINFRRQ